MHNDSVEFKSLSFLGFPHYRVGDDGSVWSCARGPWKQRKLQPNHWGYLEIFLSHNTKREAFGVAELVLLAFVGPRPEGYQACHFPERKLTNNCLANLRWDTPSGNQRDRIKHGTAPRGEQHGRARLTEQQVREIRATGGLNRTALAQKYNVHSQTIWCVQHRVSWRHI
jgi:hypothetical protein